jgi:hypothetical protein
MLAAIIASQEDEMAKQPFLILATLLSCIACGGSGGGGDPAKGAKEASDNLLREIVPVGLADRELFSRLAGTFAASQMLADGSKIYFSVPKPYGSWLCRVDRVHLSRWIVSGRPKPKGKFFEDDLEVTRKYAAWRSPQEKSEKNRDQACQEFKNFDKTFSADEDGAPSRYIFLLDQFLANLKNNRTKYKMTCNDSRDGNHDRPTACDPTAVLKGISMYSSFSGSTESATEVDGGKIHRDTIWFERGYEHGHPVSLSMEFESLQTYGEQSQDEAEITLVAIRLEAL